MVNEVVSDAAVLKRQAKEIEELRKVLAANGWGFRLFDLRITVQPCRPMWTGPMLMFDGQPGSSFCGICALIRGKRFARQLLSKTGMQSTQEI